MVLPVVATKEEPADCWFLGASENSNALYANELSSGEGRGDRAAREFSALPFQG